MAPTDRRASGRKTVLSTVLASGTIVVLVCAVALVVRDQPPALAQSSASGSGTVIVASPTLQQIDQETRALYARAREGLVRVYLPPPKWAMDLMGKDFTLRRWDLQANPPRPGDMGDRTAVSERIARAASNHFLEAVINPSTTQPSGSTTQPAVPPVEARGYRLVQRPDGAYDLVGGPGGGDRAVIDVSPRSVGLVLDDNGHILLPYFIERGDAENGPLTVACGDGAVMNAEFVGSDPATMLTVLRLQTPWGTPTPLSGRRPADGSLVLFLSPTGESARLQVWTGVQQETGVILGVDGAINGFLRQGQFLESARVSSVVNKIIATGNAKRQRVGVYIREVFAADPLRREIPTLRDRPAVLVVKVVEDMPADRAGLRDGDVILAIGGETIGDPPSFAAAIVPFQEADVPFTILRDGETLTINVNLKKN